MKEPAFSHPLYKTQEEYENARARFSWNDDDITWLDDNGDRLTKEQVAKMQSDARKAEAEAERVKARERGLNV